MGSAQREFERAVKAKYRRWNDFKDASDGLTPFQKKQLELQREIDDRKMRLEERKQKIAERKAIMDKGEKSTAYLNDQQVFTNLYKGLITEDEAMAQFSPESRQILMSMIGGTSSGKSGTNSKAGTVDQGKLNRAAITAYQRAKDSLLPNEKLPAWEDFRTDYMNRALEGVNTGSQPNPFMVRWAKNREAQAKREAANNDPNAIKSWTTPEGTFYSDRGGAPKTPAKAGYSTAEYWDTPGNRLGFNDLSMLHPGGGAPYKSAPSYNASMATPTGAVLPVNNTQPTPISTLGDYFRSIPIRQNLNFDLGVFSQRTRKPRPFALDASKPTYLKSASNWRRKGRKKLGRSFGYSTRNQ